MQDHSMVAVSSTKILCGVFEGVSFPRLIGSIRDIEVSFEHLNQTYALREFESSDTKILDQIASRIANCDNQQQFYLLHGSSPGRNVVEAAQQSREQTPRPDAKLALLSPNADLIGYVSIDLQPQRDAAGAPVFGDIGYFIDPNHGGRGVVTKAVRTILDIGFQELSYPYIDVTANPTNTPSVRLLEKLGAVKIGSPYWVEKYQAERQAYRIAPEDFYANSPL